jgi:ferric-dicitrate binding protein FerR (iron transport regulator)
MAGQRAVVSLATMAPPVIDSVTAAETARLLAWQPQLLDFSSVPLERAILEFNRRNRVQFSIADAELAAMPIVASIRSDNVEGFAQFLAATPGIQVERRGDASIVLRRNDR